MQIGEAIIQIALVALCVIVGIILAEWTHRELRSYGRDTRSNDYRRARREERLFRKQVKKTCKRIEQLQQSEPTNTN